MTKKLLFVTTLLLSMAIAVFAADATGKWTYEQPGRNGGPARQVTITLKQDGSNLTGSVPGMQGAETQITNGKVDGDTVTFDVVREFNGNTVTSHYKGVISGDEMKLTVDMGRGGPREFTAKRGATN